MKHRLSIIPIIVAFVLSVPFMALAEEAPSLSATEVDALLTQLGDKSWSQRHEARDMLLAWGKAHKDELAKTVLSRWNDLDDPEIQYHLSQALRTIILNSDYHQGAFLGIRMAQALTPLMVNGKSFYPIEVSQILQGCVAETQGIRAGDKILQIDDHVCNNLSFRTEHFVEYIRTKRPGEKVQLQMWSNNKVTTKTIQLGERPNEYNDDMGETLRQERFLHEWINSFLERHSIKPDKPATTK